MQYIDEKGIWETHNNITLLVEPSNVWLSENQPQKTQEEIDTEKSQIIRQQRDILLLECDFITIRHKEQLELISLNIIESTTLTQEQYASWLTYRQELRDMMSDPNMDLDNPVYPTKPQ